MSEQEFTKDLHVRRRLFGTSFRLFDEQNRAVGTAYSHAREDNSQLPAAANACLWAAAPEMYEALAKLVDEVAGPDAESELSTGERIALAGARVALRKARGGEG